MYVFIYKYKAHVREYSLAKTYTLLLKFPGKGKIFQRKKNMKPYKSRQMTYLIHDDDLWELVPRKLFVGILSY